MSGKICISFEVTNMLIMQDTLKKLGHSFEEIKGGLKINRAYNPIKICRDKITFDSMHLSEIEIIKSEYQRDFQIYERTVRGETFQLTETKDEIVITVN